VPQRGAAGWRPVQPLCRPNAFCSPRVATTGRPWKLRTHWHTTRWQVPRASDPDAVQRVFDFANPGSLLQEIKEAQELDLSDYLRSLEAELTSLGVTRVTPPPV